MLDWLNQHFSQDGYGGLIVYTDTDMSITCDPSWLSNQLGATIPPTYSALSELPIAQNGWQKIFDQWKANGIIA